MTAQVPDKLTYEGIAYAVIGVKGEQLPTLADFGMSPGMWHTACWRGYVASYACENEELTLTELQIGRLANKDDAWQPIQGIMPEEVFATGTAYRDGKAEKVTYSQGHVYKNLKVETYFSGGMLIADGFIRSLYVHMGFGKPYQYERVHELLFHEGTLTQAVDHSAKAAEWRDQVVRAQDEQRRLAEKLKQAGWSDAEIRDRLAPLPSEEAIQHDVEWRFSLDYGEWF